MYAQKIQPAIEVETFSLLRANYIDSIIQKCELFSTRARTIDSVESLYFLTQELFRAIHSIRGTSPMYEIDVVADICNLFENMLSSNNLVSHVNDSQYINSIVDMLDLIRATAQVEKW